MASLCVLRFIGLAGHPSPVRTHHREVAEFEVGSSHGWRLQTTHQGASWGESASWRNAGGWRRRHRLVVYVRLYLQSRRRKRAQFRLPYHERLLLRNRLKGIFRLLHTALTLLLIDLKFVFQRITRNIFLRLFVS